MRILIQIFLLIFYFCCVQSCSDIAQYYSDYYGTYGLVKIPNVPLQQRLYVEIHLSVAARLPSGNSWKISLVNTNVYDDLQNNRELMYKFYTAITNPLPIVTGVFLNGNQLCYNPPARGNYVSTIKLQYTYTLGNVPVNYQSYTEAPEIPSQRNYYQNNEWQYTNNLDNAPIIYPENIYTEAPKTIAPRTYYPRYEVTTRPPPPIIQTRPPQVITTTQPMRNDFPWLAAFYYRQGGFICGGTLLSKKIVVTAAHCVLDKGTIQSKLPNESTFYLGKYRLNDLNERGYVASDVESFILHPDWSPHGSSFKGDISVAVLSRTIIFNDYITPLCMWPQTSSHTDMTNMNGLVAGWGLTENGQISEVPMFVTIPVVDDLTCLRSNYNFAKIASNANFCAGDGSGKLPCNGDSGSGFAIQNPADNKYYFRGVVSSGIVINGRCDSVNYTVFTDGAYYSNWISYYINNYG